MVLLIDYDGQFSGRFNIFREKIPENLIERVYILGVLSEPEELKRYLGHSGFEKIGEVLAEECSKDSQIVWKNPLLKHNQIELLRMIKEVKPILF